MVGFGRDIMLKDWFGLVRCGDVRYGAVRCDRVRHYAHA